MPDDAVLRYGRIHLLQMAGQRSQATVLRIGEGLLVAALQLHANGKIITLWPPVKAGLPRMPGFFVECHILSELPMAVNQCMRRHPQVGNVPKIRMSSRIQLIAKQVIYPAATKLSGGQTDVMNHQNINLHASRSLTEIGRRDITDIRQIAVQVVVCAVVQPVLPNQAGHLINVLKSVSSIALKPNSMSDNSKQTPGRHAGLGMLIISFALGLGLLTLFFDDLLERQFNPNQRPATQALQNGGFELVLQRNRQGHYVMSGDISGEPATFLLDTGATDVVIPAELADRAELQSGQAMRAMTANGVVTVYTTTIPTLQLGDITLYDVRASINPAMRGETVLLGMSALRQVEFTQRADTLTLSMQP